MVIGPFNMITQGRWLQATPPIYYRETTGTVSIMILYIELTPVTAEVQPSAPAQTGCLG